MKGKKSRVESEKRNRAEVRRTDSIVPWWNEERERETSLCWVTIPLFGRAYADRARYIPWQKCSSFLGREPSLGNGNNRPSSLINFTREKERDGSTHPFTRRREILSIYPMLLYKA